MSEQSTLAKLSILSRGEENAGKTQGLPQFEVKIFNCAIVMLNIKTHKMSCSADNWLIKFQMQICLLLQLYKLIQDILKS